MAREKDSESIWASDMPTTNEEDRVEPLERFKSAVSANIAVSDADSHFNISVAYREMGLYGEAVRELATALEGAQTAETTKTVLEVLLSPPLLRPGGIHQIWIRLTAPPSSRPL